MENACDKKYVDFFEHNHNEQTPQMLIDQECDLDCHNLSVVSQPRMRRNQARSNRKIVEQKQIPIQKEQSGESAFTKLARRLVKISESKPFFWIELSLLMLLLIVVIESAVSPSHESMMYQVAMKIELVIYCLLTFTFFIRISNYSTNSIKYWVLNSFVMVAGFCSVFVEENNLARRLLKALRILMFLQFANKIQALSRPVKNLTRALKKILNVLIPAFFIIYIYALIGLYSFSGYEYSKCRSPENLNLSSDWTVYEEQVFLCGERTCPLVNSVQYECLNPIFEGVKPNKNQLINLTQGNGLLHFENIFYSLLSTFKQTFITGSSRLIILYKQALPWVYVELFFFSYIYLISYIYMNIFYGLILMDSWDETEKKEEIRLTEGGKKGTEPNQGQRSEGLERKNISKIRLPTINPLSLSNFSAREVVRQNNIFLFTRFIKRNSIEVLSIEESSKRNDDAKEEDKVIEKEERNNVESKEKSNINIFDQQAGQDNSENNSIQKREMKLLFQDRREILKGNDNLDDDSYSDLSVKIRRESSQEETTENEEPEESFKKVQGRKKYQVYMILHHILILACCINLSIDFHGQTKKSSYIVDYIDFIFFCLFTCDVGAKILLERMIRKRLGNHTIGHTIIWTLCFVGIIYEIVVADSFQMFIESENIIAKVFRSFKYFRFIILLFETPYFNETKKILKAIVRSVFATKNIIFLWAFGVLLLSLMGYELHHGRTLVDSEGNLDLENGKPHQISFSSFKNSIIFILLTIYNEEWDYLMFQQYLGSGVWIILWQIFTLIIGLILLSKYFMAMLVKELDDSITEEESSEVTEMNEKFIRFEEKSENSRKSTGVAIELDYGNRIMPKITKKVTIMRQKNRQQANESDGKDNEPMFMNRFMELMKRAMDGRVFMWFRIVMNILNLISLINTHPQVDRSSTQASPYLILEKTCRIYFLIELILSLMVYGLFKNDNSYLRRSPINYLNFLLTILEMMSFTTLGSKYIFIRVERLRALRLFNLIEMRYRVDWNMRITIQAMIRLLPKVFNLLLIYIILYYYFALILVKLYKDDYYYCLNSAEGARVETQLDCLNWGGDWVRYNINNSNIFHSLMYLFLVATTQGWISLMIPAMNLNGFNNAPEVNANENINIFFVIFFFFGNLIILNSFIGLSLWNFKKLKEKATGEEKLQANDKLWLRVRSQIHRLQPLRRVEEPKNVVRNLIFKLVSSKSYFIFKNGCFILYLVFCSTYRPEVEYYKTGQNYFIFILVFQYSLQLIGNGVRSDKMKKFCMETFCVCYYILFFIIRTTIHLDRSMDRIFGGLLMALQFFGFLQLIDEIPFVNKLLNSLFTIFPQTSNIFLIILITLICYTIFGMELFSFLRPRKELDSYNQNYKDFQTALFALIKFSTMESPIQQIMDAASESTPNWVCFQISSFQEFEVYGQNGCGSFGWAIFFFMSFHIFYSLLLLSTFMSLIVDAYSEVLQQENSHITRFILEKVRELWSKSDPNAKGFIPYRQFWMFTAQLLEIYEGSINKEDISKLMKEKDKFLTELNLTIYENQQGILCFYFHQVIEAITKAYLQKSLCCIIKEKNTCKLFQQRISSLGIIEFKKTNYTSSHVSTLIILKSSLKVWKRKANKIGMIVELNEMIKKFASH